MEHISKLPGCNDVSIYLGNGCNFNCTYCDRDFIKNDIGNQQLEDTDIPHLVYFLKQMSTDGTFPVPMLSFHGGEPLIWVKLIDRIMDAITLEFPGQEFPVFIQTNGSRIAKNEWFFEKWNTRLNISISYDFIFQPINRTDFNIHEALEVLTKHKTSNTQLQYVLPVQNKEAFSLRNLKAITDICNRHNVRKVDLIPLRHLRGKTKFKSMIDEIPDLKQFFHAFMKFIQMLYIQGIDVNVDGHSDGIDKHYYDNHKQLVLSPDGFIYPEYDFLEYQQHETVIGEWRREFDKSGLPVIKVYRDEAMREDDLIHDKCKVCPSRNSCGIKFLYHMWDQTPGDSCVEFYKMVDILILHAQKLKQQPTLLHWIGV
jgi:MoaA/NifB/PqqE/SkfB family radical SAM enzyme